jgi:hypothetical protein
LETEFCLSFIVDDDGKDYVLWDIKNNNTHIKKGESIEINLPNDHTAIIKVSEHSSMILNVSFKK